MSQSATLDPLVQNAKIYILEPIYLCHEKICNAIANYPCSYDHHNVSSAYSSAIAAQAHNTKHNNVSRDLATRETSNSFRQKS